MTKSQPTRKVLVVEDEKTLRGMLADNLEAERYKVFTAADAEEAFPIVVAERPDLAILDVNLPGESGFDLCKRLRAEGVRTPILMLTARAEEADKVLGLELGADDYLTKPFGLPELLARVKALLRRSSPEDYELASAAVGDVEVDFKRRVTRRGKRGEEIPLTHFEAELLAFFFRHKGEVLERGRLLEAVWGLEGDPTNRTVDNYVVKLRQRIEKNPKKPVFIQTVHGSGYRFSP